MAQGEATGQGLLPGQFRVGEPEKAVAPAICVRCSEPAHEDIKITKSNWNVSFVELILGGIIFQIGKFFVGGLDFDPKVVMRAKVCSGCGGLIQLFNVLEWVARLGALALMFILLQEFSTKSRPLFSRGIGEQVLVFSPLLVGGILGVVFYYQRHKLITLRFVKELPGGSVVLETRNQVWLSELLKANPSTASAK